MSITYTNYNAVLFAINLIGQGKTLTLSCDEANITTLTFHNTIKDDLDLQAMYHDAEQRGYDAMAEALVNIDNHRIHGQSDPKMAKVISDNIKWLVARRRPNDYGDRVRVETNVTVDLAITTALNAARTRVVEEAPLTGIENVPEAIEDAEYVPVDEDAAILAELMS